MLPSEQEHTNKWPKENAFDIPDQYFQELPKLIKLRIHPADEAHSLNHLKDKNVFNTPEGYFDQLNNKIAGKTIGTKPHVRIHLISRWWYYGAAAVAIMTIGIVLLFNKQERQPLNWEHVGEDEITAYLENNLSFDLVAQAYLENTSDSAFIKSFLPTDSSAGIEQYLIENTDTYDLIENI